MAVTFSTSSIHFHADPKKPWEKVRAKMENMGDSVCLSLNIPGHYTSFHFPAEMREWVEGVAAAFNAPVKTKVVA